MPRIMSENQLIQSLKHFWREKPTKRSGKLSLGEFMNMCSVVEFKMSKRAINQVFQVADYNDSISCVDFLNIYFKYHLEIQAYTTLEQVHDLSPSKVSYVRSCFFDREKKRHGRFIITSSASSPSLLTLSISMNVLYLSIWEITSVNIVI